MNDTARKKYLAAKLAGLSASEVAANYAVDVARFGLTTA